MKQYEIVLKKSVVKELDYLHPLIYERIIKALEKLKSNPFPLGTKQLKGRDEMRMRVGDYRILYSVEAKKSQIIIYSIAHRREVYRS